MKNKYSLGLALLVIMTLSVITVQAAAGVGLGDYVVSHYSLEADPFLDNTSSNNDAIADSNPTVGAAFMGNGVHFDGASDYINFGDVDDFDVGENDWSINLWIYYDDLDNNYIYACKASDAYSGTATWNLQGVGSTGDSYYFTEDAATNAKTQVMTAPTMNAEDWTMLTYVIDYGNSIKIYSNGSEATAYQVTDFSTWNSYDNAYSFYLGAKGATGERVLDGWLDEVTFFNVALSAENVTALFNNYTAGVSYPWATGTPTISDNLSLSVVNSYFNTSINGINVTINGTTYENETGSYVMTTILVNDSTTYDVNVSGSAHFDRSFYDLDPTEGDQTFALHQSEIRFVSNKLITGALLVNASHTVNGTNETPLYIASGTGYSVLSENVGYFNQTKSFNVSPMDNRTINITGVFSSYLNITAGNAYTSNSIINFSGWVYHPGSGNNRSYSTTDGSYNMTMIPGDFEIYLEGEGYSISSDNYQNKTISNPGENITFSLYSNNSIKINIKNEDTGATITENITITVTGLNESIYSTITGSYFLENLTDGNYSLKFSGDNYTLRTYTATVAERSTQILTAYLTSSSAEVIMSYIDEDSGATLEGVSASMSRLIGGVWTVVQSKESDITGRIQFIYVPAVKYKFSASLTDYDPKIFYLDPIIFESYNVKMSKETTITNAPDYQGVDLSISPTVFYNDMTNNITILFNSPDGLFTSYSYNYAHPNAQTGSGSGSNAYGEIFTINMTITGASFTDRVMINLTYDTTIGSEKNFVYYYEIRDPSVDPGVFTDNLGEDYGLGLFERILISLVVIIIVTGVLSMFGGIVLGAPIGLIMLGYFSYIGFMPLWASLPSLFVGFIIIVARTT